MMNRESGQAMIELSLMLLLLTFATLGMLMVCGMSDYADEIYLQSRFNAELAARDDTNSLYGEEYSTWSSRAYHTPYTGMNIPFNFDERAITGTNQIGTFGEHFNASGDSVPKIRHPFDIYKKLNQYHRLNDFDINSFKHDFHDESIADNMFNAANLVHGTPNEEGTNPLSRILSRSGFRKGAKISSSADQSYSALLNAFTKMFGVNLEKAGVKIKHAPSTTVFMPAVVNTTE